MKNQDTSPPSLRLLNWNLWFGINGIGKIWMEAYESRKRRDKRYRLQVKEIRKCDPDVLFLQELNPVYEQADQLADALGMRAVSRGDNGGVRIGRFGLPLNFCSGIAILAKPHLDLQPVRLEPRSLWEGRLPGQSWGFSKRWGAFHLQERRVYLAAKITFQDQEILLLNTHFHALPDANRANIKQLKEKHKTGKLSQKDMQKILAALQRSKGLKITAAKHILKLIRSESRPIIFAGDLNAQPETEVVQLIKKSGFRDLTAKIPVTWEPSRNDLILEKIEMDKKSRGFRSPERKFQLEVDQKDGKYDYIFLKNKPKLAFQRVKTVFDQKVNNLWLSDHFGILLDIRF